MKNKKDEIQEPVVEEISAETVNEQIVLLQKSQASVVPMANNEFEGLQGTMASKANEADLRNAVKVAVIKAHIGLKRPFDKVEIRFVIDQLKAEILRVWPGIRLEEIQLAIHRGAMGDNGKVYALSLAFFVDCIRTYMNSDSRLQAGKKLLEQSTKLLLAEKTKPSDEEIKKSKVQIALSAFNQFKQTGFYNDYGNYVFESLVDFGAVNFTEEQKEKNWITAKSKVINTLSSPSRTIDERNENQRILKEISEKKEHTLVYIEAKKIALQNLFTELKDMDVELSDLIEL